MWVQWMKEEKGKMQRLIEAAIQEAERCLSRGTAPRNQLAEALLSLPIEDLTVVGYSITAPPLDTICANWVTYRNSVQTLYDRFPSQAPGAEAEYSLSSMLSQESQPTQQLAYMKPRMVKFFDVARQDWKSCDLAVQISVDFGSRCVWAGTKIFVSGGKRYAGMEERGRKAYMLQARNEWIPWELADMKVPRYAHGLAWIRESILVFGGKFYTGKRIVYADCSCY
jgi:hypothetical protein